eukprot:Seg315.2 transcript_id=Seg315.2/GoldUCD/mRNA.D3Y31 product="hypothetical protein" protein_id=Seg315.2/GoldUCD/D3Y31
MNQYLLLCFTVVCHFVLPSICDVCNITDGNRIDCGWHGINDPTCISNGCCWRKSSRLGFPWCFFDSSIAAKLRSTTVCEHTGPAILTCNSIQQIKIHDVFYGRNADDNRCHNGGSITCFNPNATQIVKNICKTNSTCTVPSIGANWNFDSTCDGLNAQLRIHYVCIARESPVLPNSSSMTSSVFGTSTSLSAMAQSSQSVTAIDMLVSTPSYPDRTSLNSPGSHYMTTFLNVPNKTKTAPSSTLRLQTFPASTGQFTTIQSNSSAMTLNIIQSETPTSEVTPTLAHTVTSRTAVPEIMSTVSALSPVEYMSLTSEYTNAPSTAVTATVKTKSTEMASTTIMPNFTAAASESTEAYVTPIIKSITTEVVIGTTVNNAGRTTQTTHFVKSSILSTLTKSSSKSLHTAMSPKHSISTSTKAPSQTMKTSATTSIMKSSSIITPSVSATTSRASISKSKTVQLTIKSKVVSTVVSKSLSQTSKTKVVTPTSSTKVVPSSSVKTSLPGTTTAKPGTTTVKPGTTKKSKGKFNTLEYILFGVGGLVILVLLVVLVYCFKKRSPYKHDVLTDDLPAAPSGIYYAADVPMDEIPHSSVRHIATRRLDGAYDNTGVERDEADDNYDPESDKIYIRK